MVLPETCKFDVCIVVLVATSIASLRLTLVKALEYVTPPSADSEPSECEITCGMPLFALICNRLGPTRFVPESILMSEEMFSG